MHIILFRDRDPWFKVDSSGYNKSGYLSKNGAVFYPLRRKVVVSPLKKIKGYPHQLLSYSGSIDKENIETYFTQNMKNQNLFFRGLSAIHADNRAFFDNPVRLPIFSELSAEEFETKWNTIGSILCPGDLVFTFDSSSVISKIIANVDQGPWSHVASYVGDGYICEATTNGVIERPITSYRSPRFRVGIYRPEQMNIDAYVAALRSQIGKEYNYRGVFMLGLKKLLGMRRKDVQPANVSPNDLAAFGAMKLVFLI